MYHSVTFGDKNTWDDWKIVPTSRPVFNPPSQKTQYLEIPGADSALDVSESLTGYPVFNDREGSIEFLVMNDYAGYQWHQVYSEIMDYLHGKRLKAILEDDPNYFYEGRFRVNQWSSEKNWSKITIDYRVNPYKWSNGTSIDASWLWNPFNFETDYILSGFFRNIEVTSSTAWTVKTYDEELFGRAPICPVFIVSTADGKGMDVRMVNGTTGLSVERHIPNGSSQVYEMMIFGGNITMSFKGVGTVSIEFRKGRL